MTSNMLIEIVVNGGEKLTFKTVDQLVKWCEGEVIFWKNFCSDQNIESRSNSRIKPRWDMIFNEIREAQIRPFESFLSAIKRKDESINYRYLLEQLNGQGVLYSKTNKGQKLFQLKDENPEAAIMLLVVWHPKVKADSDIVVHVEQFGSSGFKVLHSALMDAYIERRLFEKGFQGTASIEKKALQIVKNEASEMLADIAQDVEAQNEKIKSTDHYLSTIADKVDVFLNAKQSFAKQLLKKQVKELGDLKKLYTEELALKIPVTYWSKKATGHRIAAYAWGLLFVLIIGIIIYKGSDFFHDIIESLKIVDVNGQELFDFTDNQLSLFFVITFPAFLSVWVLRILSKNMLNNFNQMHDANNRAVMTQTFLALMSEGKADENDRILILNALFQPVNSASDDGSPPHWFELMMERMKK